MQVAIKFLKRLEVRHQHHPSDAVLSQALRLTGSCLSSPQAV